MGNELTYMGGFLVSLHNVIELLSYFSQNLLVHWMLFFLLCLNAEKVNRILTSEISTHS